MAMFKIVLPNKEIVEINCNGDTPNVGDYLEVGDAGYRVVDVHRIYVADNFDRSKSHEQYVFHSSYVADDVDRSKSHEQHVWVYVEDSN